MAWRATTDCALGSSGPQQVFLDSNTVVTVVGQQLKFAPCGALGDPGVTKLLAGSSQHGIGLVATCPKTSQIAYVERQLKPRIVLCSYPGLQQLFTLDEAAEVEVVALAFSRDGTRLLSVSGAPDLRLSVWDLQSMTLICDEKVPAMCSAASFNPRSNNAICLQAPGSLQLWALKQSYRNFSLVATEACPCPLCPLGRPSPHCPPPPADSARRRRPAQVQPPRESTVVGSWGCHCWGIEDEIFAGTDTGAVVLASATAESSLALAADTAVSGLVAEAAHLIVACRDGSLTWYAKADYAPLFELRMPANVTALTPSSDYLKLLVSTADGGVHQVAMLQPELPTTPVEDDQVGAILAASRAASYHVGKVVGTALLAGQLGSTSPNGSVSEMVSVGEDGTLRCFDCATRAMLAATELGGEPSAVAASGALGLVAAATADGVLRVYARRPEAEPPETPSEGGGLTLVLRARLSHASITQLAFDPAGEYLVAAAADSRLVFYGCSGREGMALLGAASLTAPPASLCWFADESGAAGTPRLLVACENGTMLRMAPPPVAASAPEDLELTPQILQRAALRIESAALALAPVPAGLALNRTGGLSFFAACADGSLRAYQFNDGCRDAAEPAKLQPAPAEATWEHHSKAATALATSADGLYVATGGADGVVVVRSLSGADDQATLRLHDSVSGGVAGLCLAHVAARSASGPDGLALQLLSAGRDGVLYVSSIVTPYSTEGAPVAPPKLRAVSWPAAEDVAASGAEGGDDDEPTVLEAPAAGATAVAAGGVQSAATQALQQQREQLRERLLGLLATNADMEEGDPEKLEVEQFIIDQEQQAAWRKDGDARVATLRAETGKDNLGKELLTDRYRLEFWESMATKATTLHALACPGAEVAGGPGRAQLSNFTLAEPSPEQTSLLRKVRALRRAEQLVARFELDGRPGPASAAAGFEAPASFGAAIGTAVAEAAPVEAKPEDAKKKKGKKDEEAAEEAEAEEEGEGAGGEAAASADTGLFYRFFELHPQWRKATQAVLHEEQIGVIKASFNAQFQAVLALKRAEIERVTEKKLRVVEVVAELKKLRMWQEELDKPTDAIGMNREEEPEKVLHVADSEIQAAKYVSAAEREKQARLAAEAAEREGANADNVGVRGLKAMMDGSLETAVEEEEVMLEIVRPEWMDTIPAAEMSEDEKLQVKEFEERVKKHEAEREKRSKGLQTELAKLHQEIVDICRGFNERLAGLCDTKTRYEQAVYENELLAIKLAQARLRKELFEQKEAEIEVLLEQRKEGQLGTAARLADFKREVELVREAHEALTAEDRSLERSFRRDFADVPDFLDGLVRLYKRRKASSVVKAAAAPPGSDPEAKPAAKASKGLGAGNALLAAGAAAARDGSASADEPEREASPTRDPFAALDAPEMTQVIDPLDPAADMPEGLNFDVWDRLVEARGAKIQTEADLKASAEQLGEMNLFLDELGAADDEARNECDALAEELQARRDAELSEMWNLELPFKLKQGQLEVEEAAVVTDYSEAAFIHRGTVKSLNVEIKKLGGEKVEILKEVRDFRRGITLLQWENTRSDMEADDLTERVRDLQLLRVTKDLQGKMKGGADEKQQQEVVQLERKIDQLKGTHEERSAELKRQVVAINRLATDKEAEMENLREQIEQLEGSVLEREMIHEIQSKNKDAAGDAHKRFSEVHMKRKLQTLVGMQTQEIELLREELDRLRRRTFPTFTHYEQARAL